MRRKELTKTFLKIEKTLYSPCLYKICQRCEGYYKLSSCWLAQNIHVSKDGGNKNQIIITNIDEKSSLTNNC